MSQGNLYPLRFEPMYPYRLWGGRRLAALLAAPLPSDGSIGACLDDVQRAGPRREEKR